MKRFTALLIVMLLAVSLTACGAKTTTTSAETTVDRVATKETGAEEPAWTPDPEKTITIICPQGAGGSTDVQARLLAEQMQKISGQTVIVENVTGGSTGIGTNQVIDADPDGYTLLMYGTYVICGTMTGYTDGFEKLDFVAGLSLEPFSIVVNKDSKWQTLEELIEDAKSRPGEITLGNAGAVATTGIVCYGVNLACDEAFNVVSFNGGQELTPALLGGHVDAAIYDQSSYLTNKDQLRPLVFLGSEHSVIPELSDLPLLSEAGYPDMVVPNGCFRGICAPQGTPDEVKQWLADVIEEAFNTTEFQEYLTSNGFISQFSKLDEFKKFNDEMVEQMIPIVQATGLATGKYAS